MAQNTNNKQKVLDPNWVENKLCVVLGKAGQLHEILRVL